MGGSYFPLAAKWFLSGSLSGEESWLPTVSPSGGHGGQGRACLWLRHCDKQQMMRRALSSLWCPDKDLLWNPSTRMCCKHDFFFCLPWTKALLLWFWSILILRHLVPRCQFRLLDKIELFQPGASKQLSLSKWVFIPSGNHSLASWTIFAERFWWLLQKYALHLHTPGSNGADD